MFRIAFAVALFFFYSADFFSQNVEAVYPDIVEKEIQFGLIKKEPAERIKISLALSGGGARGFSQVGVLKAFEENGIKIDRIVGVSMGSIIGGLYSSGYNANDIDSIIKEIDWNSAISFGREINRKDLFIDQKITEDKAVLSFRLDGFNPIIPKSINTGQNLSNLLNLLALNAPVKSGCGFDGLLIPFYAVATDLITGRAVVLNKGSLSQAMRASSSVTFLVPPVVIDSFLLADGGLVANMPVEITKELGGDIVIAVNTTSPLNQPKDLDYPWIIADQMVSIPMRLLTERQLSLSDVVIEPDIGEHKNLDFSNVDSLIMAGYNSGLRSIKRIKFLIDSITAARNKCKERYLKNPIFKNVPSELNHITNNEDSVSYAVICNSVEYLIKSGDYDSVFAKIIEFEDYAVVEYFFKLNPTVKELNFSGIMMIPEEVLALHFKELIDRPYNSELTLKAIINSLKTYRSKGYSLAKVESVLFENGVLKIDYSEGIIDEIKILGNKKTGDGIIKRELAFTEGEYFLSDQLRAGLSNLKLTGLFDEIEFSVDHMPHGNVVNIRVVERPTAIARIGFLLNNDYYGRLSLDFRDENLYGSATEGGVIINLGLRNRSFILEHKANRIFDTYLTYKVRAFYESIDINLYIDEPSKTKHLFDRKKISEYRQSSYGGSIAFGLQAQRFGNLIFESKYQIDKVEELMTYNGDIYTEPIFSLRISSSIDSREYSPFSREGFLINAYYESASQIIGGIKGYTKFLFDYRNYLSFDESNTVIPRLMIGFADPTLPFSQHFNLGGANMFYGMREYEYRGRQIFLSSLEYRFKLPIEFVFDSYARIRYDLGSVWPNKEALRFKDLKHGIGAGISFDTPVGPAEVSIGKSFLLKISQDKTYSYWGPTVVYLSLGYDL